MQNKQSPDSVVNKHNYFFQITLIVAIYSMGLLIVSAKIFPYFTIDLLITRTIQQFYFPWFDTLMRFITFMGNTIPAAITILIFVTVLSFLKKLSEILILSFSAAGISALGFILKTLVARPRPDSGLIIQIGNYPHPDSFPSGHVLWFIGIYGYLLFLVITRLKKSLLRILLIIVNLALLILIGLSRIYMGAHWFSDILGSYLLGIIWIYLIIYIHKKLN